MCPCRPWVGRYSGLKKLVLGANEHDCLVIEFASQDKLYLPVINWVASRNAGWRCSPRIDKLVTIVEGANPREQRLKDALALLICTLS